MVLYCQNCCRSTAINEGCPMFNYCPWCGALHDNRDFLEKTVDEIQIRNNFEFIRKGVKVIAISGTVIFGICFFTISHFVTDQEIWNKDVFISMLSTMTLGAVGIYVLNRLSKKKFPPTKNQ